MTTDTDEFPLVPLEGEAEDSVATELELKAEASWQALTAEASWQVSFLHIAPSERKLLGKFGKLLGKAA